ncbi:MAG: class I SAM-dependent methyltransferase [Pseudomonadota bacterium]|nr:class I SAM-dependent methyltransferase [Pseudomonadota bacterium]
MVSLPNYFAAEVAAVYDEDAEMFAAQMVDPVVDYLAALVGEGAALEFGVGTGRIALPLAQRGFAVTGIDLSPHMLEQLAAKPGSEQITTVLGDFATTSVPDRFDVVYLVFNTLMNLITQAQQVACFANAATHLKPGGYFVVEVMLPRLQRLPVGETTQLFACSDEHIGIDEYDLESQSLVSHHVHWRDGVATSTSLPCRYVWPSELDLMAQLAGMHLYERCAGWQGEAFTGQSETHVSVWQRD